MVRRQYNKEPSTLKKFRRLARAPRKALKALQRCERPVETGTSASSHFLWSRSSFSRVQVAKNNANWTFHQARTVRGAMVLRNNGVLIAPKIHFERTRPWRSQFLFSAQNYNNLHNCTDRKIVKVILKDQSAPGAYFWVSKVSIPHLL